MPIYLGIAGGFRTWAKGEDYKTLKVRWWKGRRYLIVEDPDDGNEIRVPFRDVKIFEKMTAEDYEELKAAKKKKEESQSALAGAGMPGGVRILGRIPGGRR